MEEVRARLPGGPLGRGGRAKNFIVTHHHPSVQCLFAAQFLNDPPFKSRGSSHPFPCLCLQSQSHLSFSAAAAGAVAGSRSRERLDGGLRVVEEAGGAGAGVRRERGVRDGRAVRRRGRGGCRRRRGGGSGLPEGGLPLLAEGQEGAQSGRRHPLPGTVAQLPLQALTCSSSCTFLLILCRAFLCFLLLPCLLVCRFHRSIIRGPWVQLPGSSSPASSCSCCHSPQWGQWHKEPPNLVCAN